MTWRHLPLTDALVSDFGPKTNAAVRCTAFTAAAGVIGCGFVLFPAFAALRLLVGPELAALGIGIVLLALAAVLVGLARGLSAEPRPVAIVAPNVLRRPPIGPQWPP